MILVSHPDINEEIKHEQLHDHCPYIHQAFFFQKKKKKKRVEKFKMLKKVKEIVFSLRRNDFSGWSFPLNCKQLFRPHSRHLSLGDYIHIFCFAARSHLAQDQNGWRQMIESNS